MPRFIPDGRQHPAGQGRDRAGGNAGFRPIPQVITRQQGISSASAGPRPSARRRPGRARRRRRGRRWPGQPARGPEPGPRPVWAATSILLAATETSIVAITCKEKPDFRDTALRASYRTPNTRSSKMMLPARWLRTDHPILAPIPASCEWASPGDAMSERPGRRQADPARL